LSAGQIVVGYIFTTLCFHSQSNVKNNIE